MFILINSKMKLELVTICSSRAPSPSSSAHSSLFVTTGKRLASGTLVYRSDSAPPETASIDELVEVDEKGLADGRALYSPWFVGFSDEMRLSTFEYELGDDYCYSDYGSKTTLRMPSGVSSNWLGYYISDPNAFKDIRCHAFAKAGGIYRRNAYLGSLSSKPCLARASDENWLTAELNDRRCTGPDNGSALECSKLSLIGWRDQSSCIDGASYDSLINDIIDVMLSESAGVKFFTQGFDFDDSDDKFVGCGLFAALNDTHRSWFYDGILRFESFSLLRQELCDVADVLRYRAPDMSPMIGLKVDCVDDVPCASDDVLAGVTYDCGAFESSLEVVKKPYYMRTKPGGNTDSHSYEYHNLSRDEMLSEPRSSKRFGLRGATDCAISHGFTSFCSISVLDMLATLHRIKGNVFTYDARTRTLSSISLRRLEGLLGGACVSYTKEGYRDAEYSAPDGLTTWLPVLERGESFFSEDLATQRRRRLGLSSRFYAKARNVFVRVSHVDGEYVGRAEYICLGTLIVATLTNPGLCLFGKALSAASQELSFLRAMNGTCTPVEAAVTAGFVISEKQIGWLSSSSGSELMAVRALSAFARQLEACSRGEQPALSLTAWLSSSFASLPLAQEGGTMYRAIGWVPRDGTGRLVLTPVRPVDENPLRLSKLANVVKHTKGLPAAVGSFNRLVVSMSQPRFDDAVRRCLRLLISTRASGESLFNKSPELSRSQANTIDAISSVLKLASKAMPISTYLEAQSLSAELINSGSYIRSSTTGKLRRIGSLKMSHSLSSVLIRAALLIRIMMTNSSSEATVLRRLESGSSVDYNQAYFSMGCDIYRIINSIIQSL